MSEPNPYETPKTEQPLKRSQIVKRSVGLAVILLLTPPAMVIAILACCTAGAFNIIPHIILGVPLAILTVLMLVAAALHRSENKRQVGDKPRIALLLATPFCVAPSLALGFFLAASAYGQNGFAIMVAFWLPPATVLLLMLVLAWRFR